MNTLNMAVKSRDQRVRGTKIHIFCVTRSTILIIFLCLNCIKSYSLIYMHRLKLFMLTVRVYQPLGLIIARSTTLKTKTIKLELSI